MIADDPHSRLEPFISTAAPIATASPSPAPQRHAAEFTGSGSEYFRIWIVNLLLTLVTVGIYSAWAKVRAQQYFHRNTLIAGSSFDYHAAPLAILKGRIVAVFLFAGYSLLARSFNGVGALLALGIAGTIVPWLLWRSLKFRLSVTSYRGLRFGFDGTLGRSYETFLLWPMLTFFTLYLLTPFTHRQIKAYQHNYSRYGKTAFSFDATGRSFYGVYASWTLPLILLMLVPPAIGWALHGAALRDKTQIATIAGLTMLWIYVVMFTMAPILVVRLRNLIWNHTKLGEHRIESTASVWRYASIQVGNYLMILLTLGLFIPFARVRTARYLASATAIVMAGSLDDFLAEQTPAGSAAGAETADIFGIDIAL